MIKKSTLPNLLCVLRMVLIAPMLLAWAYAESPYAWLLGLFTLAAITDWLDGFLARKWRVQSPLGAMLDQISDKLLVAALLMMLSVDTKLSTTLSVLLLLREFWVSGLREYMGTQGTAMPVSVAGKCKTFLQMLGLFCVLLALNLPHGTLWNDTWQVSGQASLWLALTFSWWSGWVYTRALWR